MKQPEEIRKTYPGLEALSVEELDDLLQEEFLLSDQDGPDTDLIQAILAEIQIKEGTTTPSEEAQASLEAFFADQDQREAAPEEPTAIPFPHKPKKERTHHRKRWLPSVVAAACLVCFLCAPAAHGSTALESMINWNKATFVLPGGEDNRLSVVTAPEYLEVLDEVKSRSDVPLLPTWFPEGTELSTVEKNADDELYVCCMLFTKGEQTFALDVYLYNEDTNITVTHEKNAGSGQVKYTKKGMPYYVMQNVDRNVAVWSTKRADVSISGYLSEREIDRMVESIDVGDE